MNHVHPFLTFSLTCSICQREWKGLKQQVEAKTQTDADRLKLVWCRFVLFHHVNCFLNWHFLPTGLCLPEDQRYV